MHDTPVTDDPESSEELQVMNAHYDDDREHDPASLITNLWCRTEDGEMRWVEVVGHKPRFYVHEDEFTDTMKNHHLVADWTPASESRESIHGEPLIEVQAELPKHVGSNKGGNVPLRDYFDKTWEADIFYSTRFLIDTEIYTHFEVDLSKAWTSHSLKGDYRVGVEDIEPVEDPSWRVEPRVIVADIEVLADEGFPDPEDARKPVTVISAYDNYEDDYVVWALRHDSWFYADGEIKAMAREHAPDAIELGDETIEVEVSEVHVYDSESVMLSDFNTWVGERRPDMLSGWNSSSQDRHDSFDYPYLINRGRKKLDVYNQSEWSPHPEKGVWSQRAGRWQNLAARSLTVEFFDMMQAYEKTRFQKPDGGYGLENISGEELPIGAEKLDLEDIGGAWETDPARFLEYNLRDVQAVWGINKASGVLDLYQNIRELTGAQFNECHNNIDLLDVFVLRRARDEGIALPTSEEPDRGWYYGAHVFEPKIGRHEHVVYPDLWSMYPNMIRNVNMSPETLIGTKEELRQSEYTEDDCRWTYIDTRSTEAKKESDPQYEKVYFLDPDEKLGFMTGIVDDLMDLKDYYDGTELYDAVKRIVNSVYGVYGDSDSYKTGYRLYDWRIAEGITLGGRKMIQDTADQFVDAINDIKRERGLDGEDAYLVGGDTDSVMTSIPFAVDGEQAVEIAHEAADRVNEWYREWTHDTLGVPLDAPHYCEVEIEKYASHCFVPKGVTKEKAKKRYALMEAWDEDDGWLDEPEFSVTGIDIVRSDRAEATHEIAENVLKKILNIEDRREAQDAVYEYVADKVDAVLDGEKPLSYIARPKGMGQPLDEYGGPDTRASRTYAGAKYAQQNFDWVDYSSGGQPHYLEIESVGGDWPKQYDTHTAEDNEYVYAVSLPDPDTLPDEFEVDYDHMVEKVIEDPLTPILEGMGWNFDGVRAKLANTSQGSLADFM